MRGIIVSLLQVTQTGVDAFNAPVYSEEWVDVENVLVGEPSADQISTDIQQYGKHLAYVLAIPKYDNHNWVDTRVRFFGQEFRTYGFPTQGIDVNIPGPWNQKVKVERYG